MENEIEDFNVLPELIRMIEIHLPGNYSKDEWILLIKTAMKEQAKEFDAWSVFYACNPQVSRAYRHCAGSLRSIKEHEATEEEYQEKIKNKMKEMGVTIF